MDSYRTSSFPENMNSWEKLMINSIYDFYYFILSYILISFFVEVKLAIFFSSNATKSKPSQIIDL